MRFRDRKKYTHTYIHIKSRGKKERKWEREICILLPSLNAWDSRGCARPKPGIDSSVWSCTCVTGTEPLQPSSAASQSTHWQEAGSDSMVRAQAEVLGHDMKKFQPLCQHSPQKWALNDLVNEWMNEWSFLLVSCTIPPYYFLSEMFLSIIFFFKLKCYVYLFEWQKKRKIHRETGNSRVLVNFSNVYSLGVELGREPTCWGMECRYLKGHLNP